jgi:hypothetical protein
MELLQRQLGEGCVKRGLNILGPAEIETEAPVPAFGVEQVKATFCVMSAKGYLTAAAQAPQKALFKGDCESRGWAKEVGETGKILPAALHRDSALAGSGHAIAQRKRDEVETVKSRNAEPLQSGRGEHGCIAVTLGDLF